MKTEMLTQCLLNRGDRTLIAWIPSDFAEIGKVIELKDSSGTWWPGWNVLAVYSSQSAFDVRSHQRVDLPSIKK